MADTPIPINAAPNLYTRKQVAELAGVDHSTISRWEKKGIITSATRYNGMSLYTEEELQRIKEVAIAHQQPAYDESELCSICKRRKARRNSSICSRCSINRFKESLRDTLPQNEFIGSDTTVLQAGQKYYSRNEVANLLGVSHSTIARWEAKGATPKPDIYNNQYVYTEEIFHKIVDYAEQQVTQQRTPVERAAKLSSKNFGRAERAVATRIRSIGGRGIL
jgi:DNA-binding transcriptional MerR regulator